MAQRRFLFLQGPHGPFFASLARQLVAAGAEVGRIGVTLGDRIFWGRLPGYERFDGGPEDWENTLRDRIARDGITDIVCYGASRPLHATARGVAEALGLTFHVFEEGYLRPYWITYERGGTNAGSRLMEISLTEMSDALAHRPGHLRAAPDRWGAMRQHIFWGAVYHFLLLVGERWHPGYRPHRQPGPKGEFALYINHLTTLPWRRLQRRIVTWRIRNGRFPYHVVLCQLAHDANFRDHSDIPSQAAFLMQVFNGFAHGAPRHHHLVIKAHPLEDGREPLPPLIADLTRRHGLRGRVHLVTGGKLANLLDRAASAVTVNSTAAEQALWRGLPLRALGRAIYDRPEFASGQSLAAFFADPVAPDHEAYLTYRQYLLATSQVHGGFYSARGRKEALRRVPDMMLSPRDPYEKLAQSPASDRQQLHIVA
ncbi:capsule biosynthesis protein CapA [Alphaproteobacteria bacterium GH1-50]|uniref:Capsule biosynthesis protein CapA n=1 Tax=Kangsaoukella pontilimi TaxID=2691042 RepID=A0A7C9MR38_9RHOB|nr:capsule biosynthesis protein CapA [Kangsaoukella pontilimi]MXQ07977.1 capsule biosynthesis protein CapA [Kangsaoukella pontilimi]